MSATVTNEDKGVTTKTSGHTATTQEPSDICWNPPMTTQVPHVNNVTTDRAVEHTSGKTLFQGGNVVRIGEAVMPSEPAHGDTGGGGGVTSHTYRAEARATRGSPNVRTEGKPPARTDDPTTQNHSNTTGKIMQVVPPALLEDNPTEFLKRCSYDTSEINCAHQEATQKKQIEIWRGDTLTVTARRKNAKEPDKGPECINPPHMKWKVTRSGGLNVLGAPLPEMSEEFTGDTLTLPSEWTAPLGTFEYSGEQERNLSPEAQRYFIDQKNRFAQSNATQRGSSRVENEDARLAYQQTQERINEADRHHSRQFNNARTVARLALTGAQFFVAWRSDQNPPKITIKGNACSGDVSYEVTCYPNTKYTFEFPLDGLMAAGRWISRAFSVVRSVGQLANVQVENSVQCPGPGASVGVEFQWKEDIGTYEIKREAEFSVQGQLLVWTFEVRFPLTNFLAIIPVLGAVAARAVGWAIQWLGADVSIGAGVEIAIKAAVSVTCEYTKENGLVFDNAAIKIPIDFKFYLFVRIRLRDWVHVEGQALVTADPALVLQGDSEGLNLKSADFMIRVGFSGIIHIDTFLFTFHESGTWYPEDWTCRVAEVPLWTIIGK